MWYNYSLAQHQVKQPAKKRSNYSTAVPSFINLIFAYYQLTTSDWRRRNTSLTRWEISSRRRPGRVTTCMYNRHGERTGSHARSRRGGTHWGCHMTKPITTTTAIASAPAATVAATTATGTEQGHQQPPPPPPIRTTGVATTMITATGGQRQRQQQRHHHQKEHQDQHSNKTAIAHHKMLNLPHENRQQQQNQQSIVAPHCSKQRFDCSQQHATRLTHLAAVLCPPSRGFMMHLTSLIVGMSIFITLVLILKTDCPLASPQIGTLMVSVSLSALWV